MCLKNVFFDINTISKQMGCALQIGSSHRITSLVKIQRLDNAWWCHFWQLGPWLLACLPHSLLDISFVRCKKCKMNYYHLLPLFPKNKNMFQMEVSFICHPFFNCFQGATYNPQLPTRQRVWTPTSPLPRGHRRQPRRATGCRDLRDHRW